MDLVRTSFFEDEAYCILSIPPSPRPDTICWHYDKYGQFLVKSAYWIGMNLVNNVIGSSSSSTAISGWWKFLWHIHIPSKIKIFLWSAFQDWIPTHGNLARRHISVDQLCPLCHAEIESTFHALWRCRLLKQVRLSCSFMTGISSRDFHCFADYVLFCKDSLSTEHFELCASCGGEFGFFVTAFYILLH
ncbi:hypothetical protein ACOSQ4_006350 [Xanthoceras sorbifolium]